MSFSRKFGSAIGGLLGRLTGRRGAGANMTLTDEPYVNNTDQIQTIGTYPQEAGPIPPTSYTLPPTTPPLGASPPPLSQAPFRPNGPRGTCSNARPGEVMELPTSRVTTDDDGNFTTTFTNTNSRPFCISRFVVPDTIATTPSGLGLGSITSITGPAGFNMMLGATGMNAEFFSSKDTRGGNVAGCCIPPGLSVTVIGRVNTPYFQGAFVGFFE
jgi:hypothetical protein